MERTRTKKLKVTREKFVAIKTLHAAKVKIKDICSIMGFSNATIQNVAHCNTYDDYIKLLDVLYAKKQESIKRNAAQKQASLTGIVYAVPSKSRTLELLPETPSETATARIERKIDTLQKTLDDIVALQSQRKWFR